MSILGDGIISLRLSVAVFQVIGLTCGLLALRQYIRSWKVMVVAGLVLLVWMIPRYKLFDCSLSMIAVFFALRLIKHPSLRQHFISGVFVGLAAFFGRNHGLYNLLAFGMLVLFIRFRLKKIDLLRSGLFMGCGVLLGYSPMLVMMLMVPGFSGSFWILFKQIAHMGSTSPTLLVPWPWTFDYSMIGRDQATRAFCIGSFFVMLPLTYALGITDVLVCRKDDVKRKSLLAASVFVCVTYMHHALARAEIQHLGEGIAPLLIAIFALPYAFDRKTIPCAIGLALLLFATFHSAGKASPLYEKVASGPIGYWKCDINGDHLWLPRGQIDQIREVKHIDAELVSPQEGLLIIPWSPCMYPILQRESPLWDIFLLIPENIPRQKEMIEELKEKKVNWVLLHDAPLDGMEERRLSRTHQVLWAYLIDNYKAYGVERPGLHHVLLHRKTE